MILGGSLIAACLSAVTLLAEAGYEHTCSLDDFQNRPNSDEDRARSMCSSRLTQTVFRICAKKGLSLVVTSGRKRRDLTSSKEKGAAIFNSPSSANAFLVRKRNNPQGIVCECCVHHCTSNEFAEYCEAPSKRRKRSILKMNNAVLSHEENYHLSSEALDDEVEAFYREVDEIAQSDAPIPFVDFHRFSNKPVIRLLEQQKLNNIHRTFAMKDGDDFESKYLNLKAYFRQRLTQMLSVVGKEAPSGHSKINTTTTPAPTQEKAPVGDLQALIQLFKTEANNS